MVEKRVRFPAARPNVQGGGPIINESCGEIAELDAQPRLAGELEVAMHVRDRYAPFTDGCCHALY
jgi:hypothetical protein